MKHVFVFIPFLLTTVLAQPWDGEYIPAEAGTPDKAMPAWKIYVKNPGTEVDVQEDVLITDTTATSEGRIVFEQTNSWNGEPGTEVEVVVRVVSPMDPNLTAGQVLFSGAFGWQSLSIGHNHIGLSAQRTKYPLDMSEFQTLNIRITAEELVEIRVNAEPEPVLAAPLNVSADNLSFNLSFGDLSKTPNIGGKLEWKSIRWKQGEK